MIRRERAKRQGAKRSPHWGTIRAAHLVLEPACRACGGARKLQVHHKRPFHLHPELELSQDNLITLCEKPGHDCHFVFGHFHRWDLWNPTVDSDSTAYFNKSQQARKASNESSSS